MLDQRTVEGGVCLYAWEQEWNCFSRIQDGSFKAPRVAQYCPRVAFLAVHKETEKPGGRLVWGNGTLNSGLSPSVAPALVFRTRAVLAGVYSIGGVAVV